MPLSTKERQSPIKTPCKYPITFVDSIQDYYDRQHELCAPRPESCVQCGSARPLVKHTPYFRDVIDEACQLRIRIFRYRCKPCGRTVSFLPSFAVPRKHYSSKVICGYLHSLFILGLSIRGVYDFYLSAARSTIQGWIHQWHQNRVCFFQDGLQRLKVERASLTKALKSQSPSITDEAIAAYRSCCAFVLGGVCIPQEPYRCTCVFSCVQVALSRQYPPLGLFRPTLIPSQE